MVIVIVMVIVIAIVIAIVIVILIICQMIVQCPLFMDLDICNVVSALELIAHF